MPSRYCAMDDFTAQLDAIGGKWKEVEILGNRAIVKIRAPSAVLDSIAATATFRRMPTNRLDALLSELTQNQRNRIRDEILDAGYTAAEFQSTHPDLSSITLRQALRFLARRRLKPRYDASTDTIFIDGPPQIAESIDALNTRIV